MYAGGAVTSEEAGFKGRVLNKKADLDSMESDVDFVKKVINEKASPQGE